MSGSTVDIFPVILDGVNNVFQQRLNDREQRKKVVEALHKIGECRHCARSPRHENNFCQPCGTTGEALPEHLSALFQ